MHAARWLQQGPATGLPSNTQRTKKVDRLDLLARVINLRDDCVAQALAPTDGQTRADWDDLYDQAEHLGQQWAVSDPTDASRLLPALLPGLHRVAERFERGYSAVASAAAWLEPAPVRASMPRRGVCGICETDVTLLLRAMAADAALLLCPCCGESLEP